MRRILLSLALLLAWGTQAFAVCTWDPAHIHTNMALSNGNKTLTVTTGVNGTGHATTGYLAGTGVTNASYKLYFEITATTVNGGWNSGIDQTSDVLGISLGDSFAGVGMYNSGHVFNNGNQGAAYFTFVSGDILGLAVDFFHQKIWWTKNGTTWNNDIIGNQNPATNTGGYNTFSGEGVFGGNGGPYRVVVPAFGSFSSPSLGDVATYNGGDTSFSYTLASGFTAWCGTPLNSTQQLFQMTP
jgi:hypothetical protein